MVEQRRQRDELSRGFNSLAQEADQTFRLQSKLSHDRKEERFLRNIERTLSSREQRLAGLAEAETRKIFSANQRRRLIETEKTQNLELTKIRFGKVDGSADIKTSIASQRGAMLHKILVGKLGEPGENNDGELFSTPGIKIFPDFWGHFI